MIDKVIGLRLSEYDELIGSDYIEHKIAQNLSMAIPPEIKIHMGTNNNLQAENGAMSSPTSTRHRRRSSFGFRSPVNGQSNITRRYGLRNEAGISSMSISTMTSLSDANPVWRSILLSFDTGKAFFIFAFVICLSRRDFRTLWREVILLSDRTSRDLRQVLVPRA